MELVVQLGTGLQDERALELLAFPENFEDPEPGCRIEIWTSGRRISRRRKTESDAVSLLRERRWNEAFLSCGERRWKELPARISVQKRITLSPRSRLWKPPFDEEPPSRHGGQVRATHESLHTFVAWNEIRSYPTIVRVALRVVEDMFGVDEDQLFQHLARLIWRGLSERLTAVCSFGCADADDRGLSITDTVARWPEAISELGRRFDDLHPMLFGNSTLCRRLERALRPHLPAVELVSRGDFGMLVLGRRWHATLRAVVLVAYSNAPDVAEARARILARYEVLDAALAPRERVWRAHEEVFREMGETLFGSEAGEVVETIREGLFRAP